MPLFCGTTLDRRRRATAASRTTTPSHRYCSVLHPFLPSEIRATIASVLPTDCRSCSVLHLRRRVLSSLFSKNGILCRQVWEEDEAEEFVRFVPDLFALFPFPVKDVEELLVSLGEELAEAALRVSMAPNPSKAHYVKSSKTAAFVSPDSTFNTPLLEISIGFLSVSTIEMVCKDETGPMRLNYLPLMDIILLKMKSLGC